MKKIGLFYATVSNTTRNVAALIKNELNGEVDCLEIGKAKPEDFQRYNNLILGTSTWDSKGEIDEMNAFVRRLDRMDVAGKTVALFGLGDQVLYPEAFLNALGPLYRELKDKGAVVIGSWPVRGYQFRESSAVENNHFVGLAIDEDNQQSLTFNRISDWVESLRPYFS